MASDGIRNRRVLLLWKRGLPAARIAAIEGVGVARVRAIAEAEAGRLSGYREERRAARTAPSRERTAEMRRMRSEGRTMREIGEAFGVTQQRVSALLKG